MALTPSGGGYCGPAIHALTGWDSGPLSCDGKATGNAGLAELAVDVRERRFQSLAVQAVADDLLSAEKEILGLKLLHALLLQISLQLGPDGLGLGLHPSAGPRWPGASSCGSQSFSQSWGRPPMFF